VLHFSESSTPNSFKTFSGKEKKMQNVNVLNTDVECDEEMATDHSNKFPQMVGARLNNGEFFGNSSSAEVPSRRRQSEEG